MATPTPLQLAQVAIDALATAYTVPGATTTILKSFDICNTTASTLTVRVHLVPSGGSASAANALLYDYPIPGKGLFGWEGEQVLATGATIQVSGSGAGCTITASGVQLA